ncbi:MAG: hypothetical protein ACI8XW_001399, partial [Gammaproteobacteria bacterium]
AIAMLIDGGKAGGGLVFFEHRGSLWLMCDRG